MEEIIEIKSNIEIHIVHGDRTFVPPFFKMRCCVMDTAHESPMNSTSKIRNEDDELSFRDV